MVFFNEYFLCFSFEMKFLNIKLIYLYVYMLDLYLIKIFKFIMIYDDRIIIW